MSRSSLIIFRGLSIVYKIFYILQPVEILKKVLKVLSVSSAVIKNQTTFYPKFVLDFENSFAEYIGCKYGLSFCNGTSSIEAALFALNIGPGDEVLVPSATFHASINPILNAGATPVYIDIDKETVTISPSDLRRKITTNSKSIMVVHLWGNVAEMDEIIQIAKDHGLSIIEDASHAHGAEWDGEKVGSLGDIGCFSLQGSKPISAGEGGMAVTNSENLFYRMSMYGHFGRHGTEINYQDNNISKTGLGTKRRANPLGIAAANIDLRYNDYYNRKKNKNWRRLGNTINKMLGLQMSEKSAQVLMGGYFGGIPLRVNNKKASVRTIIKLLNQCGIAAHAYPYPMHHQMGHMIDVDYRNILFNVKATENIEFDSVSLPVTETLPSKLLFLDSRFLVFLPFWMKWVLAKVLKRSTTV
ncbi:MAG: DegT/DnrJ/EryC1/StrS family aminotransferase [Candidatus Marinimicrobia bacterium]|nr:DegT/DnrJ/EryC1/StrS family aminotransferase [Candidatus Neomarinimicrobiota bacterium]